LLRNENWEKLKNKLTKAHEKRIMREMAHMGETPESLDFYLKDSLALTSDEREVYEKIRDNGKMIAGDLANFSQATTWFMDDTPLSLIKWSTPGQTYDRMVNDLGSFQKSNQALMKILGGRPFNDPPTEVAKNFAEAIQGASGVLGLAGQAQDNYYDLVNQYLKMIQERPQYRQMQISDFKHMRLQPTSRAQEITGSMESPATDEEGTFEVLKHFLNENVLRREVKTVTNDKDDNGKIVHESQVEDVMKAYHLGWWNRLVKKNVRDFGPTGLIAFLITLFKTTFPEAKFE
jgi:hypothetical protein